jgi:hypothetical protein
MRNVHVHPDFLRLHSVPLSDLQLQQPEPDRGLSTQTESLRSNPKASALFVINALHSSFAFTDMPIALSQLLVDIAAQ